jgi:hypothetical protein
MVVMVMKEVWRCFGVLGDSEGEKRTLQLFAVIQLYRSAVSSDLAVTVFWCISMQDQPSLQASPHLHMSLQEFIEMDSPDKYG